LYLLITNFHGRSFLFFSVFIVLFILSTSTIFTLLHLVCLPLLLLLELTPRYDLFYLPAFHFLKCILIVQGHFTLVFHTCIFHKLIRLTPFIIYFLCHPDPLLFNSLQCISLYYLYAQTEHFRLESKKMTSYLDPLLCQPLLHTWSSTACIAPSTIFFLLLIQTIPTLAYLGREFSR
jgi:hypothetical protein